MVEVNNMSRYPEYDIEYHIVWTTKDGYRVKNGKVAERLRELIKNGCEAMNITIIQGAIGKEYVHLLVSSPPNISPLQIVQYLKGKSSKLLQEEFKELKKKYWGQYLWAPGYFCKTEGTVTKEMIEGYIKGGKYEENFKILK